MHPPPLAALLTALTTSLICLVTPTPALAAGQRATLIDLGAYLTPTGISNSGTVVGTYQPPSGPSRAVAWRNGQVANLDPIGVPPSGSPGATVRGINHATGTAVGASSTTSTDFHGTLWHEGRPTDLGPGPYCSCSDANSVNSAGHAVGQDQGRYTGIGWFGGAPVALPILPNAMNESDTVVGLFLDGVNPGRAAWWTPSSGLVKSDSGCQILGVNSIGTGVGFCLWTQCPGCGYGYEAVYSWDTHTGVSKDLGDHNDTGSGARALAINSAGTMVGYDVNGAFIWRSGSSTPIPLSRFLPSGSGWILDQALDINDYNQIVGVGHVGAVYHAFVMDLATTAPAPPQSVVVLPGQSSVDVFWSPATFGPGASSYLIAALPSSLRVVVAATGASRMSATLIGLAPCTSYFISVTSISGGGSSPPTFASGPVRLRPLQSCATYFALGDSYSSGEGVPPYYVSVGDSPQCDRSSQAWPLILSTLLRIGEADLLACSGATAECMAAPCNSGTLHGEMPETSRIGPNARLITITAGGNDLGFARLATNCAVIGYPPLSYVIRDAGPCASSVVDGNWSKVERNLDALYLALERLGGAMASGRVRYLVVPYPAILDFVPLASEFCGNLDHHGALAMLIGVQSKLNTLIRSVARRHKFEYVDAVEGALNGHTLCSDFASYVNPITTYLAVGQGGLFHPNYCGQMNIAATVAGYLSANPTAPASGGGG